TGRGLDGIAAAADLMCNRSKKRSNFPGFALHLGAENDRVETQGDGFLACGAGEEAVIRDDHILNVFENGIAGLWGFRKLTTNPVMQPAQNSPSNFDSILL